MRLLLHSFLIGSGVMAILLAVTFALDPVIPLLIPLGPGFVLQKLARLLGADITNRTLFWMTPLGWWMLAAAIMALRSRALTRHSSRRQPAPR